jgi:Sodium:sulfate symporter transmembrane region
MIELSTTVTAPSMRPQRPLPGRMRQRFSSASRSARTSPVYFGSGYLPAGDYWRLGAIFGIIYIVVFLVISVPLLLCGRGTHREFAPLPNGYSGYFPEAGGQMTYAHRELVRCNQGLTA